MISDFSEITASWNLIDLMLVGDVWNYSHFLKFLNLLSIYLCIFNIQKHIYKRFLESRLPFTFFPVNVINVNLTSKQKTQ